MFTGIIAALGTVVRRERRGSGERLWLAVPGELGLEEGSSLAVNGACLTVAALRPKATGVEVGLDLSPETLARTNLRFLKPQDQVNLEPPLAATGRFDGHIVLGHVDALGEVVAIQKQKEFHEFTFAFPPEREPWLVEKGSIAVDGISLTAYDVHDGRFRVAVIPYTYEKTNLHMRRPGDPVNLEFDILGKYVAKLLRVGKGGRGDVDI